MTRVLGLVTLAAALYLLWLLLLFFMQRAMIYPGARLALPQFEPPEGVESLWLEVGDLRVEAWWMPPLGGTPRAVALFAHGNAELIDYSPDDVGRLRKLGIAVLAVEYPGYGRSKGSPEQQSVTRAMLAAHDWIRRKASLDGLPVIGYGRSLGGGAIGQLAAARELDALILESTFSSAREFAKRYLAPGSLVLDSYDTVAVLAEFSEPVLIVHGIHDEIIPYHHSERLLRAATDASHLRLECGHNDCPPDWNSYLRHIDRFVTEAVLAKRAQP